MQKKTFILLSNDRLHLPFIFNPSGKLNGKLPFPWKSSTFTVNNNKIINTPTEGSNLILDGNMELAGVANWANSATPTTKLKNTVSPLYDTQDLHLITDAADFEGAQQTAVATNTWYAFGGSYRVVSGSGYLIFGTGLGNIFSAINVSQSTKTDSRVAHLNLPTANITAYLWGLSPTEIYYDNIFISPLFSLRCFVTSPTQNIIVKIPVTLFNSQAATFGSNPAGVSLNWDSLEQNGVDCYITNFNGNTRINLVKWLNGSPTSVLDQIITYGAGNFVEVRKSGTTYQVFYNSIQIGTNQTISDAAIISNKRMGIFNVGGGSTQGAFTLSAN